MKRIILPFLILWIASCTTQTPPDPMSKFAGMYKLYIAENQDSAGNWYEDPWTKGGTGYIIYDGKGHMAVQITPAGYKDFPWFSEKEVTNMALLRNKIDSMKDEDLSPALFHLASDYVYIANASVNDSGSVVTHDRISHSDPTLWNTQVKRHAEFKGDTLVLQVVEAKRRLKWIRQK